MEGLALMLAQIHVGCRIISLRLLLAPRYQSRYKWQLGLLRETRSEH
jgi:hypothetical protein